MYGFGFQYGKISGGSAASFFLDTYTGAAAAYSLQKIKATTTNVIKARRSSDDAELDFTAAQITDGTLTTWTGAGDGFVTIWYDQSEDNHIINATSGEQPKIVDSGSVVLENGKPALDFGGSSELNKATVSISSNDYSFFGVANTSGNGTKALFRNRELGNFGSVEGAGFLELNHSSIQNTFIDDGSGNALQASLNSLTYSQQIITTLYTLSTAALYSNGSQIGSSNQGSGSTPLTGPIALPYLNVGGKIFSRPWQSTVQEIILYNSNQTANKAGIESNINGRYTIY